MKLYSDLKRSLDSISWAILEDEEAGKLFILRLQEDQGLEDALRIYRKQGIGYTNAHEEQRSRLDRLLLDIEGEAAEFEDIPDLEQRLKEQLALEFL